MFRFMKNLLGQWDYYVSPVVKLPGAVAKVSVEAAGMVVEGEGECAAYIYGWAPGDVEYIPGACTTIVFFRAPSLPVPEDTAECKVTVQIETLGFAAERQVCVCKSATEIVVEEALPNENL